MYKKTIFLLISIFLHRFAFSESEVARLVPMVITKIAHALPAFTQGLAIDEDQLYESTGLYGQSTIRLLNISTGEVIRGSPLSSNLFGEGIAVFPDQIIQLTWKELQTIVYDRNTLKIKHILFYSGEGWGLCRDENTVWMSNGTSVLTQRNIETFSIIKTLDVHLMGRQMNDLNDLECVGNFLYANVYGKNDILQIDKLTGAVSAVIDASSLLSRGEKGRLNQNQVLNGIAFRPKNGTFFLTGKEWPWIFEVRFVSADFLVPDIF